MNCKNISSEEEFVYHVNDVPATLLMTLFHGQIIILNCRVYVCNQFYCRMLHAPGLVWLPSFFPRTIICSVLG
jgi:hypothetical protein